MNKEKLRNKIETIIDESNIDFYVMGAKASSRFDYDKTVELEPLNDEMILGYRLYAIIADAVFYKAKRKEDVKKGESIITSYFQKVLNRIPKEYKDDANSEVIKANAVLNDFIYSKKIVEVSTLLATFFPIIVLDYAIDNNSLDKKKIQNAKKNRERIINFALLSIRSLFRAFLTIIPVDENTELKIDVDNPINGIFKFKDSLFIPTNRNAFSLKDFKTVIKEGIDRISDNFSLQEIKNINVFYFVKDTIACYKIDE